jgi:hypothetical protein
MKFKKEEVKQIRSNFVSREGHLKTRPAKKQQKCISCGVQFSELSDEKIAVVALHSKGNKLICNGCAKKYSEKYGIEDLYFKIERQKKLKQDLINEILALYLNDYRKERYKEELNKKEIEELEKIRDKAVEDKEHRDYIDSIDTLDWVLESYLEEQYGVIMDRLYLKDVSQLEDYFADYIGDAFDCGQGYAQSDGDFIVFINHKYYAVHVEAEIGSAKQDRGDRLYWVEGLENLTYKEIPKPVEKQKEVYHYKFSVEILPEEKKVIDDFLLKYIGDKNA